MAKDCLLKNLTKEINNESLPVLGLLKANLRVSNVGAANIASVAGSECLLTVVEDGVTIISATGTGAEKIDSIHAKIANNGMGGGKVIFSKTSGTVSVEITNKYAICDLAMNGATDEKLDWMVNLIRLTSYSAVAVHLSILSKAVNLTTLESNYVNTVGKLDDLGHNTKLTYITLYNSSVTGTVEAFVAAQRANGRTTCTNITTVFGNTSIKFNSQSIIGSGEKALSWTDDTITFDGVTISA